MASALGGVDLSPRNFHGLLSGLCKRSIFGDASFTDEFLIENLFTDSKLSRDAIEALFKDVERLLWQAGQANWSITSLEDHLSSTGISPENKEAFLSFWRQQSGKIHDIICDKSVWTDTLQDCSWRVDMMSSSRRCGDLGNPTAIMELRLGKRAVTGVARDSPSEASKLVRFELTRDGLAGLTSEVAKITAAIARYSS